MDVIFVRLLCDLGGSSLGGAGGTRAVTKGCGLVWYSV